MEDKMPGYLCIFAFLLKIPFWYIYLFSHQPEGRVLESAMEQLKYSFDPSEPHFTDFLLIVASAITLLVCAYLFLATKHHMLAMLIVAIHAALALFYFGWGQAIGVALPLIFLRNELRRT